MAARDRAFTTVIVPVSLPGIVATIIFSFILGGTSSCFALVLTSSESMYPVTVGIASFVGQWRIAYETMNGCVCDCNFADHRALHVLEKHLGAGAYCGRAQGIGRAITVPPVGRRDSARLPHRARGRRVHPDHENGR